MSRRQHEPNGDNLSSTIQTRDDEKVSWHPWANNKKKSVRWSKAWHGVERSQEDKLRIELWLWSWYKGWQEGGRVGKQRLRQKERKETYHFERD